MSVGLVRYAKSIFLGLEPRLIVIIYSSHLVLAFTLWPHGRNEPIARRVALMTVAPEVNLVIFLALIL